ncbi:hypothetical protein Ae201684P_012335 [Aphanomyces euteiches]|uniref:RxLR effector protein n=1 Tax=Aphanomyces euteiches TaxID=100861 RepID=A0A6G0W7B8_9STRA|nr:hypothetical protein Ae201684_018774 [Aphanomyces euteiches]KAH9089052.1 hypothetical protein Ae201684P_012335 [Aphanomyces euteiches]
MRVWTILVLATSAVVALDKPVAPQAVSDDSESSNLRELRPCIRPHKVLDAINSAAMSAPVRSMQRGYSNIKSFFVPTTTPRPRKRFNMAADHRMQANQFQQRNRRSGQY